MITITAFQPSAFQFTGFQIAETVSGSGGWIPFWHAMLRREMARRKLADAKRKKKQKQEEDAVQEVETVALRFVTSAARAPEIDLAKRLRALQRVPVIDEAAELAEFRAMMEMVMKMEDFA